MDEIIITTNDLIEESPKISVTSIIPSILLPIVNTLATPYYKKQLIEAQATIKSNTIIANERKYRAVLDLIYDLSMAGKLTPSVECMLSHELDKFS